MSTSAIRTSTVRTATIRTAGIAGAVGGALTLLSGVTVQAVVVPASTVSPESWSYPWTAAALVPVSLVYSIFHVLVLVGIVGLARSGLAGDGRAARAGCVIAVVGTAVLAAAELASIPFADEPLSAAGPSTVGAVFGAGTVLSAVGLIIAGVTTIRARRWAGWRRFMPLATGCWLAVLVVLVMTPLIAVGVGIYGALLTLLGVALATDPVGRPVSGHSRV
jgi:hypothetical protein